MGRIVKKLPVLILCAALLLWAALSAASAASTVYLMAVNERVVETTVDNIPVLSGGVLYVPYTMFSSQATGINLGVSAQYSAARGTVLVSSGRQAITFDIRNNTAVDILGHTVSARAMLRNSMPYIPLDWVCAYFDGIAYSIVHTGYGTLIRVTNSAAILSDADFVDTADNMLRSSLYSYREALSGSNSSTDAPGPGPSSPPVDEDPGAGPRVYLSFRWGERATDAAERLESRGQRALFLFTVDELRAQDDLVRRLAAAGHTIGLALTGDSVDECLAQAEEGGVLLAHAAYYAVQIVSADSLNRAGQQTLRSAGYALWEASARPASGSALLQSVRADRANYVELTCDERGYTSLVSALGSLTGSGYSLTQAVAPVL